MAHILVIGGAMLVSRVFKGKQSGPAATKDSDKDKDSVERQEISSLTQRLLDTNLAEEKLTKMIEVIIWRERISPSPFPLTLLFLSSFSPLTNEPIPNS